MPPPARGPAIQNGAFLLLVAVTTIAFLFVVAAFLMPVFWAAVLATVFFPVQRRYVAKLAGRRSLAAIATLLTIIAVVVLPLALLGVAVTREALQLAEQMKSGEIDVRAPVRYVQRLMPIATEYLDRFGVDLEGLLQRLSTTALAMSQIIAAGALAVGQDIVRITALFFVMLYILFFFLRDGRELANSLIRVLPLGDARERRLFAKFREVSRATLKGTLVVGIVQGAIGGILFWIVGIPAPVFWGAVMTIFSVLPAVGPALVWAPAAIIFLAIGAFVKAIVLIVGGVVVIGLVDNVLRPILVGRDAQLPDYVVLIATLGGIAVFGISGFVIGPLIAAFFLVVWEMFADEHAERAP